MNVTQFIIKKVKFANKSYVEILQKKEKKDFILNVLSKLSSFFNSRKSNII